MNRWVPFWLWAFLFWPAMALAEFCWQQGLQEPLFTNDGGISFLVLSIVWLVLLFEMRPKNKSEDEDDEDEDGEDDVLPNAVIVVTCTGERAKILTRELNIGQLPEVDKYIVIDNDVMFPTSAQVTQVGQVFDNSSVKWRIAARVDFKEQFEQLAASSDWQLVTIPHSTSSNQTKAEKLGEMTLG